MKTLLLICVLLSVGCTTISPDGTVMRDATGNAWASLLLPGAGQFCNEEYGKGLGYLGLATAVSIAWVNSERTIIYTSGGFNTYSVTYRNNTWLYSLFAISILSAIDAYKSSQKYNLELSLSPDSVRVGVNRKF